jgi:hypothetical protein
MPTSRRGGRGVRTLIVGIALTAALAVVALVFVTSVVRNRTPSVAPTTQPGLRTHGYLTSGNKILSESGQPFITYGMTVFGLAYPDWQSSASSDAAQIAATAKTWHGNTVRLQVAPPDLLQGNSVNQSYLAAVDQEVKSARSLGMNVILTAQYERTTSIPMPDQTTVAFWRVMAPVYAHDSGVWFDLFNEPRLRASNVGGLAQLWNVWQKGGDGYVGMQTLLDTVRSAAADNLVLAEGIDVAKSLAGLPGHTLTGSNIAYAVHPYFVGPSYSTPAAWDANWGIFSEKLPVVVDEWGEYQTSKGVCVPNAPTLVPEFLAYLDSHHIGLIAWSLAPGVLTVGNSLTLPNSFSPNLPFQCTATPTVRQGSGADVLAFFAGHSRPAPRQP